LFSQNLDAEINSAWRGIYHPPSFWDPI